ncbi:hypothetical protein [Staphylococcus phage LY01]|nr:hypothetical protein [Staphylococcus phage LY01]
MYKRITAKEKEELYGNSNRFIDEKFKIDVFIELNKMLKMGIENCNLSFNKLADTELNNTGRELEYLNIEDIKTKTKKAVGFTGKLFAIDQFDNLYYTAGNTEFYKFDLNLTKFSRNKLEKKIKKMKIENSHLLDNGYIRNIKYSFVIYNKKGEPEFDRNYFENNY